jgi:hypothetical protein
MDPTATAPTSYPPEYVNASNAARIVGVVGAFHFIALTFVSLRVYVRLVMVRAFGVDDGLIVLACVGLLLSSSSGLGGGCRFGSVGWLVGWLMGEMIADLLCV